MKRIDKDMSQPVSPKAFRCSCGCDLVLSRKDFAEAAHLLSIAGDERHAVSLAPTSTPESRSIMGPPEPTITVKCSQCRGNMEVLSFAADLMKKWSVFPGKMVCEGCRESNEDERPRRAYEHDYSY